MTERVWSEKDLLRRAKRRLAVLQHAEEVSGSVAATCRYYGISRTVLINLEHGTTRGSLDTWHRVTHGLGVPLGSLMDQLCHGHRPSS